MGQNFGEEFSKKSLEAQDRNRMLKAEIRSRS
jgi:hypothetical protein